MVKKLIAIILDDFFIYVQHVQKVSNFLYQLNHRIIQMPALETGGTTPIKKRRGILEVLTDFPFEYTTISRCQEACKSTTSFSQTSLKVGASIRK